MRKSARRSLLFAPAHHPGLFAKAVAKGADIVCIECEDAVFLPSRLPSESGLPSFHQSTRRRIIHIHRRYWKKIRY